MRRLVLVTSILGLLTPLLAAAPAHAQASRTWVSGVGDDVNPCSRTAPCKTFAGAISKTAAGGEINCLDPAGFGAVTITKALTIDCETTQGSILAAGSFGVQIAAGANDRVTLRGIKINGVNQTAVPGTIGIRIAGASAVSIEHCVITGMGQQGISDLRTAGNTKLYIRDTIVSNNTGNGIALGATNTSKTDIVNVSSINNLFGMGAVTGNSVVVRKSTLAGNSSAGATADPGAQIDIDDSSINNNGTGVQAAGTIRVSNSDIANNGTAASGSPGTYGNNRINGNTALGSAFTAVSPGQQ